MEAQALVQLFPITHLAAAVRRAVQPSASRRESARIARRSSDMAVRSIEWTAGAPRLYS